MSRICTANVRNGYHSLSDDSFLFFYSLITYILFDLFFDFLLIFLFNFKFLLTFDFFQIRDSFEWFIPLVTRFIYAGYFLPVIFFLGWLSVRWKALVGSPHSPTPPSPRFFLFEARRAFCAFKMWIIFLFLLVVDVVDVVDACYCFAIVVFVYCRIRCCCCWNYCFDIIPFCSWWCIRCCCYLLYFLYLVRKIYSNKFTNCWRFFCTRSVNILKKSAYVLIVYVINKSIFSPKLSSISKIYFEMGNSDSLIFLLYVWQPMNTILLWLLWQYFTHDNSTSSENNKNTSYSKNTSNSKNTYFNINPETKVSK